MQDFKQYIYISETKVEMFYGQLVRSIEKHGADYGIDVGLLKWTGKRESEEVVNIYTKLNRVVEFIKQSKKIGTPGRPKAFVAGTGQFRWGVFGDDIVYFQSAVSKTKNLVLVGSSRHVPGAIVVPKAGLQLPGSVAINSLRIGQALEMIAKGETTGLEKENLADFLGRDSELVAGMIERARKTFDAPAQRLEFLAQAYLRDRSLVIGTPLYVAAAE